LTVVTANEACNGRKTVAKSVGITKDVHVHSLRHTYATHLLEDGMDIITLKDFGPPKPETTLEYLQIAQLRVNKNSAHLTHFCTMQPQVMMY
jgi:site-specific recombinase XerD